MLLIAGIQPAGSAAEPGHAITRAREVRTLRDEALKAGLPVKLRGIVLHRYSARPAFIIQDESDAIFVELLRPAGESRKLPADLAVGTLVEIEGLAASGSFAPIVKVSGGKGIRVLGTAPLPPPQPLTAEAARAGLLDAHLVVVEGVVRRARPTPISYAKSALEMVFEGTRLFIYLDKDEAGRSDLVDARIRVTGISSGIWNKQGQITAPCLQVVDQRGITVLKAAPADPFALPARSVTDIMRYRPEDTPSHRMHVAGAVLHSLPDGRVFVYDGESAVCAECTDVPAVAVGDAVDVAGFSGMRERSPLLEDAVLRVRKHHAPLPEATRREAATLLEQCKDYELIQMDAVLLETQRTRGGIDLLLQSGDSLFKAGIEGLGSAELLSELKPDSLLSLTGLVLFSFPSPTNQEFRPNGFSLLLRSPADVRIVRQPPWWTSERLLGMLGATTALVLVFALWNHFLRARARVQQDIISAQARREATSEERTRLARELHDTLEQEFVGMARQTEALEHAGPLTPQAGENLDLLRQMLQLSRDNARRAVWDLRDPALLDGQLDIAIRHAVQRIAVDKPLVINFHSEMGEPAASIPPNVQVNVLRLAQEAVTNAVKHAGAKTIEVALRHHEGLVELTVTDDGRCEEHGDAQNVAPAGHFGIIGMRERCEKLGGRFELHAQPGGGMSVRAQIPVAEIRS